MTETSGQPSAPPMPTGQMFEKVMLTPGASGIGTLTASPGRLEFESPQTRVSMPDVREIAFEYERVQAGAMQRTPRVRVTHGTGDALTTTYVSKMTIGLPRKAKEANEALAVALQRACGTTPLAATDLARVAQSTSAAKAKDFDAQIRVGRIRMWVSAVVITIGVLVTVISYSAASAGGSYIVAWGAMVFGALFFVAGAIDYFGGRRGKERASGSGATPF